MKVKKNSELFKEIDKDNPKAGKVQKCKLTTKDWLQVCCGNKIPIISKDKITFYPTVYLYIDKPHILFARTMKQLVKINKKFNHSKQSDFKKLESIVCSAFNKYDWVKQMRDIQAQIYVDIMFKHPFLDGNKRTALYWIYKLTHDDYDKFDEYTFKGIIEALEDK